MVNIEKDSFRDEYVYGHCTQIYGDRLRVLRQEHRVLARCHRSVGRIQLQQSDQENEYFNGKDLFYIVFQIIKIILYSILQVRLGFLSFTVVTVYKKKGKTVPEQAQSGLHGTRMLRLPD